MSHSLRALLLALIAFAVTTGSARASEQSFDTGWRFVLVNKTGITDPTGAYAQAASPAYDDSGWRSVDVPHDWSIELDPVTGTGTGTSSGTGYLQGGLGWYRKTFTLPASAAGKALSIAFDGVYMDSIVYLNGVQVGAHPYGYTGFSVDISAAKTDGTPNVLAVQVRHQQPSSRWYSGSGIYRHVHLLIQDPVHVARHGVVVTTPGLSETYRDYATVHVATSLVNALNESVGVSQTVRDAEGTVVASTQSGSDMRVDHPHLWSIEDPYLYTLTTEVRRGGGVVDSVTTRFGIRWFEIDPNQGFTLNGVYTKIKGVDLHHDLGALGSAINRDALVRQMKLMKSMGVNAFRTSHNPPSPEMMEVCEELGIVTMVEAFDAWRQSKVQFDYARFFDANSDADIREMVDANRNNPSVIMWSIGNEIPGSTSTAGIPIANKLIADIKAEDATRKIVIGSDQYRSVPSPTSAAAQVLAQLDGLGLNYNTAASVDGLHAAFPSKFLFESESSSETSTRGVYQDPDWLNTGENYTPGKRGVSSYDNNLASWTMSGEYGHKKDRDRKYFLGEFLWSGIDYIGEPTPYNVFPVKASHFGAVDTAGFAKDMYWLFRSQWTSAPMVHLLPMNWTDWKPGEDVAVWAYANVNTVELFLNGQSLGVRKFDHKVTADGRSYLETTECTGDDKTVTTGACPGSYTSPGNGSSGKLHLSWNVPFEPGRLVAVASRDGAEVARDEVVTAGEPAGVSITPDRRAIVADGHSLSFLTLDVVDRDGVVVPSANNKLTVDVTGGRLAGLDSGQEESAENYKATTRSAFNGKLLAMVQSGTSEGPITVRVSSPGLEPQTVTINALSGGSALPPVYVRAATGAALALPASVRSVSLDGTTSIPVTWPSGTVAEGTHTVSGSGGARAIVTGYSVDHVDPVATLVATGVKPMLPGRVRVVYTDGSDRFVPVHWDDVAPPVWGRYTVRGDVPGAVATVTVTDAVSSANLGRSAKADASFSGAVATIPSAMLDGSATTQWSSFYNKAATALLPAVSRAHASEWVSLEWPAAQTISELRPAYTRATPLAVRVSYWDGSGWADAGSSLTFAPVNTTRVRLELTSPAPGTNTGFFGISELEANGKRIDPSLIDLKVNGVTVPGFDPAVTSYTLPVQYDRPPVITGTPAGDETVTVNGSQVVVAADGLTRTYTLTLIPADIETGTIGAAVPATLSLLLGSPASFGPFVAGVARDYTASTAATVTSTAGDATLSVSDPSTVAPGRLVNGSFALTTPLAARAGGASFGALGALLSWAGPVSNDQVTIDFRQSIGANEPLRTGTYAKTLTFTLSTTAP